MAVTVIALLYNYLFMIANLCKLIYNIFTQTGYHYNNEMGDFHVSRNSRIIKFIPSTIRKN